MYVTGGFDKHNAALDSVEQLVLVANEVCTVTTQWKVFHATMTTKRAYHGMLPGFYHTNSVCVVGGQSEAKGDGLSSMECLGAWNGGTTLSWKQQARALNTPRTQFAVTVETIQWSPKPDDYGLVALILGGKESAKRKDSLSSTEFFSNEKSSARRFKWTPGPFMREGRAFFGAGAAKDMNELNIIAVGGEFEDGLPSDTMEMCVGLGCYPTSAPTASPSMFPSSPTDRPTTSPSAAPSPSSAPTTSPTWPHLRPTGKPTPSKSKKAKPDLAVIVTGSAVALGVALYCAYRRGRARRRRAGSGGYERQYSDERELDPHASGLSAYGSANPDDDRSQRGSGYSSGDRARKPSSHGPSRKGTFASLSFPLSVTAGSGTPGDGRDGGSSAAEKEHIIRQLEMRVDHMEEEHVPRIFAASQYACDR